MFKVGDRVRFKPEHCYYRDTQRAPDEFVIDRICEQCAYWDGRRNKGAFFHRLILVPLDGPW